MKQKFVVFPPEEKKEIEKKISQLLSKHNGTIVAGIDTNTVGGIMTGLTASLKLLKVEETEDDESSKTNETESIN